MKKAAARTDKYYLRDLHLEIDLYDRKLAYMEKYEEFASDTEREEAEKKLLAKRAPLERAAMELVASGVEYEEKDLPRSYRALNGGEDRTRKNLTLVKKP